MRYQGKPTHINNYIKYMKHIHFLKGRWSDWIKENNHLLYTVCKRYLCIKTQIGKNKWMNKDITCKNLSLAAKGVGMTLDESQCFSVVHGVIQCSRDPEIN